MNKQCLMMGAFGALMALGIVAAQGKELSRSEVPEAVIKAFEKANPNAQGVEFEGETFEGKAAYEAEYKDNGKEYEFLYSADGMLLQKEEEIDVDMLSEEVVKAVKKAHPKAKIEEAEKLMKPDGTFIGYEVEIKSPKRKAELTVGPTGKILKTEKE